MSLCLVVNDVAAALHAAGDLDYDHEVTVDPATGRRCAFLRDPDQLRIQLLEDTSSSSNSSSRP